MKRRRGGEPTDDKRPPAAAPPERADRVSTIVLIAANLLPLVGALLFAWDASAIILLYWAENLVAGFYNVLRMALVAVKPAGAHLAKLFFIPFFCVHFGGFCAVHGVFLLAFFDLGDSSPLGHLDDHAWPGPLIFIGLLVSVVRQLLSAMPPGMIWPLVALFVSHGVSFVENYLLHGEYRTASLERLMLRPYGRMVVLHVAIIFGAVFVILLGSSLPLLAILVVLKLCLDLYFHRRWHLPAHAESPQMARS